MPITFTNHTQELTYRKVSEYLTTSELFKNSLRSAEDRPKFNLIYGSIEVGIRVLGWEVNPWETPELVIVRACSCITVGSHITPELTEYLLLCHFDRSLMMRNHHFDKSAIALFSRHHHPHPHPHPAMPTTPIRHSLGDRLTNPYCSRV
jgi:hypothetical protein